MTDSQRAIDAAIAEADRLIKVLKRDSSTQVRGGEERQVIRATGLSWFNTHRAIIAGILGDDQIKDIDDDYRALIGASSRAILRTKYLLILKSDKEPA